MLRMNALRRLRIKFDINISIGDIELSVKCEKHKKDE